MFQQLCQLTNQSNEEYIDKYLIINSNFYLSIIFYFIIDLQQIITNNFYFNTNKGYK